MSASKVALLVRTARLDSLAPSSRWQHGGLLGLPQTEKPAPPCVKNGLSAALRLVAACVSSSWELMQSRPFKNDMMNGAYLASWISTNAFQCRLCRLAQVWNPRSGVCTGTIDTGYGLSLLWAPGNRHVVVGTKVIPL